ncbi:hypothetical protein KIN20_034797 [Parelaphostrongylus tenuis]|uniref:Uncharacterized protein n=1 Tax=Parelaphostrongylus tenuis TaxID=148309 RepID=A0AAD5WK02_PARTN|nr:hypothetical protein KIN20_034797 [Parelaphostrongylus tenuis]
MKTKSNLGRWLGQFKEGSFDLVDGLVLTASGNQFETRNLWNWLTHRNFCQSRHCNSLHQPIPLSFVLVELLTVLVVLESKLVDALLPDFVILDISSQEALLQLHDRSYLKEYLQVHSGSEKGGVSETLASYPYSDLQSTFNNDINNVVYQSGAILVLKALYHSLCLRLHPLLRQDDRRS